MKHMRIQHIILASLLAVMMTFAACKASPVVRVVMPTAQKIDQQMQPDHTQKTSSQTSSSSQTSNANASAVSSNNSTSSGTVSTSSTTSTDSAAGQATPSATTLNGADLPGGTYGNSGGSNGVAGQGTGTGGTGQQTTPMQPQTPPQAPQTPQVTAPDRLAAPTAVQVDGQTKQLPTNATKVAAAGQYADMVCMLGGADALLDTSPENKSGLFQEAFNLAKTTAADMPAVGNAISQSNFSILLNNVKPQVVFYTDGTFTQDQLAQLTAAQIWPVELIVPETVNEYSDYNTRNEKPLQAVTYNVDVIANVLKKDITTDGQHPLDIANAFDSYFTNQIEATTASKYSYAPFAHSTMMYTTLFAQNLALNTVDVNGNSLQPASYSVYNQWVQATLQIAPILQICTLGTATAAEQAQRLAYCNTPWGMSAEQNTERYRASLRSGTENDYFTSSLEMIGYYNTYNNASKYTSSGSGIVSAPGHIIVPTKNMTITGADPNEKMEIPGTWFPPNYWGAGCSCYSSQLVQLNVQPTGLHSWTSGGPESILEPLWLRSVFWSSDYSAAQFQSDLSAFYVKFYHCSQSTASTLAASILSVDQ